jgi:hypothetical protein
MFGYKNAVPGLVKLGDAGVGVSSDTSNFSLPSQGTKQVEALAKLQKTGEIDNLYGLTNKLDFKQAGNEMYLVDQLSNKPLGTVSEKPAGSDSLETMNPKNSTNELKVIIRQEPKVDSINQIELTVMPTIQESRTATYDEVPILHHPGGILKYKNSSSRSWAVTGQLISRTMVEAEENLGWLNMIRSWTMPFYGVGTSNNKETAAYLGAPPPILTLTAYGDKMIGPVTCVLETYSWTFPNNVDYIKCAKSGNPFPVILDITLNLKESFSPAEYSGFDLVSYKQGLMRQAFNSVKSLPVPQQPSTGPIPNATQTEMRSEKYEMPNEYSGVPGAY